MSIYIITHNEYILLTLIVRFKFKKRNCIKQRLLVVVITSFIDR